MMFANIEVFVVMVIYLAGLIGIGLWAEKKNKTGSDYFLGGRKLGPWVLSMSEKASESSGFMSIGLPGEAYSSGISAAWNSVTASFSIFNWIVTAKPLRRFSEILKAITIPDYMEARFKDDSHAIRFVGIVVMILFMTVYVCAQFVASGKLFEAVLGIDYSTGVIIGAIITVLYTVMGGFLAVAITDFFQGLLMAFGLGVMPLLAISQIGGLSAMVESLAQTMPAGFNAPFFGSTGLSLAVIIGIISYLAIGFGFTGSPHILVRYMATRSTRDIKRMAIIGIIWMMIAYYGAVFLGMAGQVLLPGLTDPEQIYPKMAMELFPAWLAGILVAAALSAMMSSVDSMLLIGASSIAEDFWNKVLHKGEISEKKLVLVSRISTLVMGVIGLLIALHPFDAVFWIAVYAWAGLGSCFGPPIILSLYWKGVTKWGALAGMIIGPAVTVIWRAWKPIAIYEGGPAFIASLLAVFLVSLVTNRPSGEEFERNWDTFTKKTEIGTPMPLPSELVMIRNTHNLDLKTSTEIEIVSKLLSNRSITASAYVTA